VYAVAEVKIANDGQEGLQRGAVDLAVDDQMKGREVDLDQPEAQRLKMSQPFRKVIERVPAWNGAKVDAYWIEANRIGPNPIGVNCVVVHGLLDVFDAGSVS
jgi:hypothetical protein